MKSHFLQFVTVSVLVAAVGCATQAPRVETVKPVFTEGATPLTAGFVHDETVHASGRDFSTDDLYWTSFFPEAAKAFTESRQYGSRDEALASDVDVVVVGKSLVYGSQESFKYTLAVRVMTPREKTVGRAKIHQRPVQDNDAESAFNSMGGLIRRDLLVSESLKEFVKTGEAGTK